MKKSILIFLAILSNLYLWAESPCSSSTGNVFRRTGAGGTRTSNIINVSLDENCAWVVSNLSSLYQAYTTRAGWVLDSLSQSPGVGSTILPLYTGSCVMAKRVIRMTAYFRDNRLTRNRADDRFCQMVLVDTAILQDKLDPIARTVSISTASTSLTPGSLKHHFGSAVLSDNCSPLSVLQNNLEFAAIPSFPSEAIPSCDRKTRYTIRYRTRDLCGNISNWAVAIITLRDTISPRVLTMLGPNEIILNNSCATTIQRSQFEVYGVDDYTPSDEIIFSYRVIGPASLAGNIPNTGKLINASGLCAPDNQIRIRVCAQDCFGNGNLHLSDNLLTPNCEYITIALRDTIKPTLTGTIPTQLIPISTVTCTAEMPNLASALAGYDNCGDVSIYQLPAPGSILNDGNPSAPGLARGISRTYTCEFLKEPDDAVDCATVNGSIIKSVDVSFLVVDCHGNCSIRSFPGLVQLYKATTSDIIIPKPFSKFTTATGLLNFPNPFNVSTLIRVENDEENTGDLTFYSMHGQLLGKKHIQLNKGVTNISIDKNELNNYSGIIIYALETFNKRLQKLVIRKSKMIIE